MPDHLVDIYNDRYEHIGVATKRQAHERGLWHCTFGCLVLNPAKETVLLQKKYTERYKDYGFQPPDYADITVGGHYEAGETISQGIRELHEEIGLTSVNYQNLQYLGMRQCSVTLSESYIECTFEHLHLLPLDLDLDQYPLGNNEVCGLVEITISDAIALASGAARSIPMQHLHWPHSESKGEIFEGILQRSDLIPNFLRMDQLYLRLFLAAQRYLNGERKYLFW